MFAGGFIDAHCHLADLRLESELDRLMKEASASGIGVLIQGGVDPQDWARQKTLKDRYPGRIVTAYGLHPWWVASHTESEFHSAFAVLGRKMGEAQALGEIGLDHSPRWEKGTYDLQLRAFREQLGLLKTILKPVVLHVVRAHDAALGALKEAGIQSLPGIVHSFSGPKEIVKRYLDLGLTLSISGVITRKGFETLRRAVSYIPIDRLVVETDSPDQKPEGWPRAQNEPVALMEVARAVGELRGMDRRELLERSAENLKRVFQL